MAPRRGRVLSDIASDFRIFTFLLILYFVPLTLTQGLKLLVYLGKTGPVAQNLLSTTKTPGNQTNSLLLPGRTQGRWGRHREALVVLNGEMIYLAILGRKIVELAFELLGKVAPQNHPTSRKQKESQKKKKATLHKKTKKRSEKKPKENEMYRNKLNRKKIACKTEILPHVSDQVGPSCCADAVGKAIQNIMNSKQIETNQEQVIQELRDIYQESDGGHTGTGEDNTIFDGREIQITDQQTGSDITVEITVKTSGIGEEKVDWTQDFSQPRKSSCLEEEISKEEMDNPACEKVLRWRISDNADMSFKSHSIYMVQQSYNKETRCAEAINSWDDFLPNPTLHDSRIYTVDFVWIEIKKPDSTKSRKSRKTELSLSSKPTKQESAKRNRGTKEPRESRGQAEKGVPEDSLFTHIKNHNLYLTSRAPTKADGNCWFRAMADQVVLHDVSGVPRDHVALRLAVVEAIPSMTQVNEWRELLGGTDEGLADFLELHGRDKEWTDDQGIICQATAILMGRDVRLVGTANIGQPGPGYTVLHSGQEPSSKQPLTVGYWQGWHFQSLSKVYCSCLGL